MTQDELLAEVEIALLNSIRRAWRQVQPAWADIEAAAVVTAASGCLLRDQPGLDERGLQAELVRYGVLVQDASGALHVRVPDCRGPVLSPTSLEYQ